MGPDHQEVQNNYSKFQKTYIINVNKKKNLKK